MSDQHDELSIVSEIFGGPGYEEVSPAPGPVVYEDELDAWGDYDDAEEIQEERIYELYEDGAEEAALGLVETFAAREGVKGSEEEVRDLADQLCDEEIAKLELGGLTPAEIAAWGPQIAQESVKMAAKAVKDAHVWTRALDRA
jgi:hypothetical protein